MKIEIRNISFSNEYGYEIYDLTNKRFIRSKNALFPRSFSENDILNLLGKKKYLQFEKGKYEFNISGINIFKATEDMNYYNPKFVQQYLKR